LNHAGETVTLSLENNSMSDMRYVAFYADIQHEVKPVTDGYRVCLVYNLVRPDRKSNTDIVTVMKTTNTNKKQKTNSSNKKTPEPQKHVTIIPVTEGKTKKKNILKLVDIILTGREYAVYVFEHKYTLDQYSFSKLKGNDRRIVTTLMNALRGTRYHCAIGLLEIQESGYVQGYDEDDNDPDAERTIDLAYLIDIETGKLIQKSSESISTGDMFPKDNFDDIDWDHSSINEHTGNEGTSYEKFYKSAALAIWERD